MKTNQTNSTSGVGVENDTDRCPSRHAQICPDDVEHGLGCLASGLGRNRESVVAPVEGGVSNEGT
jgi:hypothetical protein